MTHEETIELIQKLVPSVMELDFGCEVKLKYISRKVRNAKVLAHYGGGKYQVQERIDSSTNEEEYEKDYGHCEITYYEPDSFEILGKPITLGVVFQAIHASMISLNQDDYKKQESSHDLIDYFSTPEGGVYGPCWNLSKDNFNDQSEETKTFIGGLLGN